MGGGGGACKINSAKEGGRGVSKTGNFEQTYFLNDPLGGDYIPYYYYFFFYLVSFNEHSRITGLQGKGEAISLTPHYHFHPLHRHLDYCRELTSAHSLQLDSNREPLVSERKSLTTKRLIKIK